MALNKPLLEGFQGILPAVLWGEFHTANKAGFNRKELSEVCFWNFQC